MASRLAKINVCAQDVFFQNWYLLEVKKEISSHAHKTGSWYLSRILFNISNEHPRPFIWELPRGLVSCSALNAGSSLS